MQRNEQKKSLIKRNILQYLESKGLSKYDFYLKSGVARGTLDNNSGITEDGIAKFIAYTGNTVNLEWLLTGVGKMESTGETSTSVGNSAEMVAVKAEHHKKQHISMPQVVTVDNNGNDNIVFVPVKARAGYLNGFGDPAYIGSLPAYQFPGVHNGTYRMFEIEGLSMHPTLNNADIVICDWVQDFSHVRDERVYVIVTTEGIVVKRVINRIHSDDVLILKSDNIRNKEDYPTIILHTHDIKEIWYCRRKVSADFSAPGDLYNRMTNIEAEIHLLRNEIRKKEE